MEAQRILHIIGKMDRAGAETMLMNLYRNIDRTKIQFDFVTFTTEVGDYDKEIKELGGNIIPIVGGNAISRMIKLQQFLKLNYEYKVVHCHMLLGNAFHLLAAKNAQVKHRISHSHSTSDNEPGIIRNLYKNWSLLINRQVSTYKIACGIEAAQYLFGTQKNVLLLPNAVDVESMLLKAENSRDYINSKYNGHGLKIIQVGRFNSVKNHDFSLQIAEKLKERNIPFKIYFVGQGPLEQELKSKLKNIDLVGDVIFLGLRSDIAELMSSADVMIMPSLHEGFPVVLVESQAVSLNTIVSDRVSTEVDLGLGLVDFLPVDCPEKWVEHILDKKKSVLSQEKIVQVFKKLGFDVSLSAKKLEKIYLDFIFN